jgi:preprotein translocase subunit SecE
VLLHDIASNSTLAPAEAGLCCADKNIKKSTDMAFVESVKESYNELVHKVSWPTRKELAQSSVIVLIASIILALIVWLMDWCFESIMTFIYCLF